MVYTSDRAHSHLEMPSFTPVVVSVILLDAYTITDTDPILPKMVNTKKKYLVAVHL